MSNEMTISETNKIQVIFVPSNAFWTVVLMWNYSLNREVLLDLQDTYNPTIKEDMMILTSRGEERVNISTTDAVHSNQPFT